MDFSIPCMDMSQVLNMLIRGSEKQKSYAVMCCICSSLMIDFFRAWLLSCELNKILKFEEPVDSVLL